MHPSPKMSLSQLYGEQNVLVISARERASDVSLLWAFRQRQVTTTRRKLKHWTRVIHRFLETL
jgi:hypothetical protein